MVRQGHACSIKVLQTRHVGSAFAIGGECHKSSRSRRHARIQCKPSSSSPEICVTVALAGSMLRFRCRMYDVVHTRHAVYREVSRMRQDAGEPNLRLGRQPEGRTADGALHLSRAVLPLTFLATLRTRPCVLRLPPGSSSWCPSSARSTVSAPVPPLHGCPVFDRFYSLQQMPSRSASAPRVSRQRASSILW